MKPHTKNRLLLPALIAGLGLALANRSAAQTFRTLHSFTNRDGASPQAGLVLSGNALYGTAPSPNSGTVFAVKTDGSGFTNLYNFTASSGPYPTTNSDGAYPDSGLILSGNILYGTAPYGGSAGNGTVFAVNTDGTGFTNLHSFVNASDGVVPWAGLILAGNTLYGTTLNGGSLGKGTVFAVNTDGAGFTNLHSFTGSGGAYPNAGVIVLAYTLYGTTQQGGSSGNGTVFKVNINGTGFTNLHSCTAAPYSTNSDGVHPVAGLILTNSTLYGTASAGGTMGQGTVFNLSLGSVTPPQLSLIPSGADVVLTWPTNYSGFTLQSTTNLGSSAVWATNSPPPVVVNGLNTLTNPISGRQQFYRLTQ
jgi:uncharacterized repeat protein (TIGR03803 family)